VGTQNPDIFYIDGSGESSTSGPGYFEWIEVVASFDYSTGEISYDLTSMDSSWSRNFTANMNVNADFDKVQVVNVHSDGDLINRRTSRNDRDHNEDYMVFKA